jgi:hypothetical protein
MSPSILSTGNGDMFDIVVHKKVWPSEVIVSDILDSDHLPITYNVTITVTMQLINILSFVFFITCFGLSRPSSGVSLYAKTVTLY